MQTLEPFGLQSVYRASLTLAAWNGEMLLCNGIRRDHGSAAIVCKCVLKCEEHVAILLQQFYSLHAQHALHGQHLVR